MEHAWEIHNPSTELPGLDEQPSDTMIKAQLSFCENGALGVMELNKIVSDLPKPGDVRSLPAYIRKRQRDGTEQEEIGEQKR